MNRRGIIPVLLVSLSGVALIFAGCETSTGGGETVQGFRVGEPELLFSIQRTPILDTDLSPDGSTIACYHYDEEADEPYYQLRLYDTATGQLTIAAENVWIIDHARPRFSPDGSRVVYAELFGFTTPQVYLYDIAADSSDFVSEGSEAAWDPAGDRLAIRRDEGLYLHDIASGEPEFLCPETPIGLEFSPDGAWIYGFLDGRVVRVGAADGGIETVSDFDLEPVELEFELLPDGSAALLWLPGYPAGFTGLLDISTGEVDWLEDQFDGISFTWPALIGDDESGYLVFQRSNTQDGRDYYGVEVEFTWTE